MAFTPIVVENGITYDNADFMNELQRRIKNEFDSVTGVVPELLWKNNTPTAPFNSQNLTINTSNGYPHDIGDYDEIIIYFSEATLSTEVEPLIHMVRGMVGNGANDNLLGTIWGELSFNTMQNSVGLCNYKRPFYSCYNILSFSNASEMQEGDPTLTTNNYKCIPLYVFGLKNGIKSEIANFSTT